MNGWRPKMEDAHVIFLREAWAFFGVFDGHGGDMCSKFIANRIMEELDKGRPEDDQAVADLVFKLDREFLDTGETSGSTGTFVFASPADSNASRLDLLIGNIGDSRVLLARPDGSMVEGPGTDGALTTDHKPDHPDERERIERTGGHVKNVNGVHRVNGDLAVSRAFGDGQLKKTGHPPRDHPVTAEPDFLHMQADATDLLILVCDGISEGSFPNREVAKLVAQEIAVGGDRPDPGKAAAAVCVKALEQGSKDNLSCMVVLLSPGEVSGSDSEFRPGPFEHPRNKAFRRAYVAMAEHAELTLAQAVEMRYDQVGELIQLCKEVLQTENRDSPVGEQTEHHTIERSAEANQVIAALRTDVAALRSEQQLQVLEALEQESGLYGDGPPADATGDERTKWFDEWIAAEWDDDNDQILSESPQLLGRCGNGLEPNLEGFLARQGLVERLDVPFNRGVGVRVGSQGEVRSAMREHADMEWEDKILSVCNCTGWVERTEGMAGGVEVFFKQLERRYWLPSVCLTLAKRIVRIADMETLKPAMERHPALKWEPKFTAVCGRDGEVRKEDPSDRTIQVKFPEPLRITAWLPLECVTDIDDDDVDLLDCHRCNDEAEERLDALKHIITDGI